jgi:hypothetical protein
MTNALIGHTGFVGSNLAAQVRFPALFNSRNSEEMRGRDFDVVVCAGISAVKWKANKEPEDDWKGISRLLSVLETVKARRFVLISTVDVYPQPQNVSESSVIDLNGHHAYGLHRLRVEHFIREHFALSNIIRLPGLFGAHLKKNVIFDLLNDNGLDVINPASSFQYYCLDNLWSDIQKAIELELPLLNLACEPVRTSDIVEAFFSGKTVGSKAGSEGHYDMHSEYAAHWSGDARYQYSHQQTMASLKTFISSYRGQA